MHSLHIQAYLSESFFPGGVNYIRCAKDAFTWMVQGEMMGHVVHVTDSTAFSGRDNLVPRSVVDDQ